VAEVVMPARETELLSTEGMSSRGKVGSGSDSGRAGRGAAGDAAARGALRCSAVLCGADWRGEARALAPLYVCGYCWAVCVVCAVWRGGGPGAAAVRCAVCVVGNMRNFGVGRTGQSASPRCRRFSSSSGLTSPRPPTAAPQHTTTSASAAPRAPSTPSKWPA
jgi:hypothetical protein